MSGDVGRQRDGLRRDGLQQRVEKRPGVEMRLGKKRPDEKRGRASFWWFITVAALLSAAGVTVLVLLLAPPLQSALSTQVAEPGQTFEIGADAEISLEQGWTAQTSLTGDLLVRSPDRLLEVQLAEVSAEQADRALQDALAGEGAGGADDAGQADDAGDAGDATATELGGPQVVAAAVVQQETLQNGAVVRHVDRLEGWTLVLDLGDVTVLLEARVDEMVSAPHYRAAIADLLLRVGSVH